LPDGVTGYLITWSFLDSFQFVRFAVAGAAVLFAYLLLRMMLLEVRTKREQSILLRANWLHAACPAPLGKAREP
jgi:hypothetical protein